MKLKRLEFDATGRINTALLGRKKCILRCFQIYSKTIFSALVISYDDFANNTRDSLEKIINYCDLHFLKHNIDKAMQFVKKN